MSACVCVSMHWGGGRAAGRPLLSRITSTPASLLRRGISFGEQKELKRVSNCAKYHMQKSWLRGVLGKSKEILIVSP